MEQSEAVLEYQRPTGVSVTVLGNGRLGTTLENTAPPTFLLPRHYVCTYNDIVCVLDTVMLDRNDPDTAPQLLPQGGVLVRAQSRGQSICECGGEHAAHLHEPPWCARQASQSLHRRLHQQGE